MISRIAISPSARSNTGNGTATENHAEVKFRATRAADSKTALSVSVVIKTT